MTRKCVVMSMNRANLAFLLATPINYTHYQCHAPCYVHAQTSGLLQSLSTEGTKAAAWTCARGMCSQELYSYFRSFGGDCTLQRRNILLLVTEQLIENYVDLKIPESVERSKKGAPKQPHDGVHDYAKDTLVLGLFLMEFNDSIREGGGDRIIRC